MPIKHFLSMTETLVSMTLVSMTPIQYTSSIYDTSEVWIVSKFQQNITYFVPNLILKIINNIVSKSDAQKLY